MTVGIVIGAGILGTPGLIAEQLRDPVIILGMWFFGGVMAGLSTLVLAEMAAAFPEAGGKYVFARHAWGDTMGFVAGWSEVIVTRGFSGASKAVLISTYVFLLIRGSGDTPDGPWVGILALAVVLAYFLLHTRGLKASTTFQNITTAIKVVIILAIAAVGIVGGSASGIGGEALLGGEAAVGLLGYALAYQSISFAYYGWEDAAKMSEEVVDPGRALPKILLGGALSVMVLYLLINVSYLVALTPAQMAESDLDVAVRATAAVFGDGAATMVLVASLLILISSANVNFLGLPRVAYGLARNGLAPRALGEVDARGTPRNALYLISAWIGLMALTGSFSFLIRFMMTVAITVDTMVLLGYFRLRALRPDLERPFRMPGHPVLPAITVVLYIAILGIIIWTQPELAMGAGAMLGCMLIAGVVTTRRNAANAS